jgi:ParB family transcriptional regulator, chromosome partitioning protein
MQIIEAKLSDLKIDPANVRQTDKAPDEGLLASIRAKGVLYPLVVRKNGGTGYYVTDGGKRLAALHILARDGDFDKTKPIQCALSDDDAAAAADTSLTLNFIREDMHPVDEFEAFAKLVDTGKTPEAIAKDYGIPLKLVGQRLALGRLCPEVRAAWRDGKLDDAAARVFTLEPDLKRQAELLAQLRKRSGLHAWNIKKAIVGGDGEAKAMINFVGLDAYKAAGGATTTDLFADSKDAVAMATDLQLLKKLYDEKLKSRVKELKEEGWKWVEFQSDLPYTAQWWTSKGKNAVKADDRSKYGIIIAKGYHGEIEIKYGVVKPAEEKAAAKKKAAAKDGTTVVALPAALCGRLSEQMTEAAAEVLKTDSNLALAIVAAALTSHNSPVNIDGDGMGPSKFEMQLPLMRQKSVAELHKVLADVASEAVSIGASSQDSLPLSKNRPNDRVLLEALDAKKLNAALRACFDAADYFAGVTVQACKEAIALCDPKQPITGKEKKSELAKIAADLVKKSNAGGKAGYLPPEMRTSKYDGPALKAAAKPAAKAKAAKKKAR